MSLLLTHGEDSAIYYLPVGAGHLSRYAARCPVPAQHAFMTQHGEKSCLPLSATGRSFIALGTDRQKESHSERRSRARSYIRASIARGSINAAWSFRKHPRCFTSLLRVIKPICRFPWTCARTTVEELQHNFRCYSTTLLFNQRVLIVTTISQQQKILEMSMQKNLFCSQRCSRAYSKIVDRKYQRGRTEIVRIARSLFFV